MKNNQNGFGAVEVVITLCVLAVLGGAGWYVFNKNNSKEEPKPQPVAETTKETIPEDTSQEYTDENTGYTVKIPKDWSYREGGGFWATYTSPDWVGRIKIVGEPYDGTLANLLEEKKKETSQFWTMVSYGSGSWDGKETAYTMSTMDNVQSASIYYVNNGNLLEIIATASTDQWSTYEPIFSKAILGYETNF